MWSAIYLLLAHQTLNWLLGAGRAVSEQAKPKKNPRQFNVDTQFGVLRWGSQGLVATGRAHRSIISLLVWGFSSLSLMQHAPLSKLEQRIQSQLHMKQSDAIVFSARAMLGNNSSILPHFVDHGYPNVRKPLNEDPCGLLLCWECNTSHLAVPLPRAAPAR